MASRIILERTTIMRARIYQFPMMLSAYDRPLRFSPRLDSQEWKDSSERLVRQTRIPSSVELIWAILYFDERPSLDVSTSTLAISPTEKVDWDLLETKLCSEIHTVYGYRQVHIHPNEKDICRDLITWPI